MTTQDYRKEFGFLTYDYKYSAKELRSFTVNTPKPIQQIQIPSKLLLIGETFWTGSFLKTLTEGNVHDYTLGRESLKSYFDAFCHLKRGQPAKDSEGSELKGLDKLKDLIHPHTFNIMEIVWKYQKLAKESSQRQEQLKDQLLQELIPDEELRRLGKHEMSHNNDLSSDAYAFVHMAEKFRLRQKALENLHSFLRVIYGSQWDA